MSQVQAPSLFLCPSFLPSCFKSGVRCYHLKPDVLVAQSCPTLCNPMDCSPPGSSIHGIFQARIPGCIAIPFSRGSSWPMDGTQFSRTAGRFFTVWATIIWSTCSYFRNLWCLIPSAPNFRSCKWNTGLESAFHREREEQEVEIVPGVLEEEAGLRSLWKSPTQREERRPRGINQTERRSQSDWGFFVVIKILVCSVLLLKGNLYLGLSKHFFSAT